MYGDMGMYDTLRLNFDNGSNNKLSSPIFGSSKKQIGRIDVVPGLNEILVLASDNLQTLEFKSRLIPEEDRQSTIFYI